MSYSAFDAAPFLEFNDPALERELTPEERKKLQEDYDKKSYISTYLPSFPDLHISIIDYISAKKDILVKDNNGKTLLESWFETPRSKINELKEQRAVVALLFNTDLIIPNDELKERMINMVNSVPLFSPQLEKRSEEEKSHFIQHFDLLKVFKRQNGKEQVDTTWFDIFLINSSLMPLIPVVAKYHPNFIECLNFKEKNGANLAHKIIFSLCNCLYSENSKDLYFDILHTIDKVAPDLFNEKHSKLGTPYELSIICAKEQAKEGKSNAEFDAQIGEVWKFFIDRKLEQKIDQDNKKNTIKKKI